MLTVVTGAAGFIGSRLVEALNARGVAEILAVDGAEAGARSANLARLRFAEFLDKDAFLARLGRGALDGAVGAVLHQGASSDTLQTDGAYMMRNNTRYSGALLDWCQARKVPLVYASSAAVYGAGPRFGEARAHERPLNAYGYSKLLFDQQVRRRLAARRAPVAGLRYFNVYGPNEAHKGRMASVAFHAFQQLRAGGPVRLFEASGGYAAGEQRRDFIHVDDAVAVNLWLLGAGRDASGIYNCGTGRAQTFNELAAAVINSVRGTRAGAAELAARGLIEYVEFPPGLRDRYQSFTEADLRQLRAAGYAGAFRPVEAGVADYVKELASA